MPSRRSPTAIAVATSSTSSATSTLMILGVLRVAGAVPVGAPAGPVHQNPYCPVSGINRVSVAATGLIPTSAYNGSRQDTFDVSRRVDERGTDRRQRATQAVWAGAGPGRHVV